MGILDGLVLALVAVGIVGSLLHLHKTGGGCKGCGGCGSSADCKAGHRHCKKPHKARKRRE